ncbi:alkane 1-monooxygenase [Planctobacterium marinum]|uniref:alkane 1-monooxygenase n=1 Tax=Planctobacterium marinum TaxID=1631968 RepID=UPI001E3CE868|nr:alkane 1-monooxygenase [Planctobacterium marinum]MCC2604301.1 alkane 1-monooxygenase [Planctobacterium marinum]
MHYLKFFLFHFYALVGIVSLSLGGMWIVAGFLFTLMSIILGDLMLGDDLSEPAPKANVFYHWQLWSALPLLSVLIFSAIWQLARATGEIDLIWWVAVFYCGLLTGTLGTVTAHELVHRKWGSTAHSIGRWLLAFSFDSNFAIEHVFGHHINIATTQDAASAPRGRNVYQHMVISTIQGNISAWNIEKKRLLRTNTAVLSLQNRFIHGVILSLILMLISYVLGGLSGLLFFVLSGVIAKSLLEIVNYMEHYGLVRVPGKRVFPRHSWNANNKISSWSLFNLTRHSHHHANANVPFQYLKPMKEAPLMPTGYLGTLGLTLVPPLWFYLMKPRLAAWDEQFASPEERQWLLKQNEQH